MPSRVRLFYNERMSQHTHPWAHFERRTRTTKAFDHLKQVGLLDEVQVLPGHRATDKELLTVHTRRHLDEIRKMTEAAASDPTNRGLCEPDGPGGVYYSAKADACARLACGCVVDAACSVLKESQKLKVRAPPAFALVRPPGHHAGADDTEGHHAEGFCFFNSVAVAAGVVRSLGLAKKVAILDWDVHHGNGTQNIFYEVGDVLYISLHRFGERWYPETGDADEVGDGDGVGGSVNVPWVADGLGDSDYLAAFKLVVLPVLSRFAPDLLLISAGFDAADGDAQGKMNVTPLGFGHMTQLLLETLPSCPIAAALEGGCVLTPWAMPVPCQRLCLAHTDAHARVHRYNVPVTSECVEATLRALLGVTIGEPPPTRLHPSTEPTLRSVIDAQRPYWPCLRYGARNYTACYAWRLSLGHGQRHRPTSRSMPTCRSYA